MLKITKIADNGVISTKTLTKEEKDFLDEMYYLELEREKEQGYGWLDEAYKAYQANERQEQTVNHG